MGGLNSTPKAEGDRQVHIVDTMEYRAIAANFKRFIETMSDQACAIDSAIKSQNANIEALSSDTRMSPGRTYTHTELLERTLQFNQDSLMHYSRNMVSTVEDFKSTSQPVIEAFDSSAASCQPNTRDSVKHGRQDVKTKHSVDKPCSVQEAAAMKIVIEDLKRENDNHRQEIQKLKQRNEVSMKAAVGDLQQDNMHLKQELNGMRKIEDENKKLTELLASQYASTRSVSTKNVSLQQNIERLQEINSKLDSNNTSLEHKVQRCMAMEKEITILTDKNVVLSNDKQFLLGKVDKLEKTSKQTLTSGWFSTRTSRKTVTAHVYCPRKGDLATSVVSEMSAMLRTQFEVENMDLCLNVVDGADIRPDIPVLVICINASRLGTDASNALSNLPLSRAMSLVILHHKDVHALPSQTSDRVLTAPDYKRLGGIFDMAFLTGKGMYTCDMNNSAVANIVAFIKQHK